MKKRLRSVTVLFLVLILALTAACSNQPAATSPSQPAATSSSQPAATGSSQPAATTSITGGHTVGINYFGTVSVLAVLRNNSEVVVKACGDTPQSLDDNFNVDKIITDLQSMIQNGCEGVIIWTPVQSQMLKISQMCQDAKIPFVLNDKVPTDPAIIEALNNNPYFAGAIGPENTAYGKSTAEYCLAQGWKTCIITAPTVGDPTDQPRIDAFTTAYTAGGGKIVTQLNGDSTDAQQRTDDALVTSGEVDVIYGTGPDYSVAAVQSLKKYPDWKTKVVTAGLDETVVGLLADPTSTMKMTLGDYWVCGQFSAMILEHYINGNPLKGPDGKAIFISDVPFFTVPASQVQAFKDTFIKQNCYSDEEIVKLCSANYDDFVKAVHSFSFQDRATARGVTIPQ